MTRIDKWLWAARFYKTRALAVEAIARGHAQVDGKDVKPAREVKAGDTLDIWQAQIRKTVVVLGVSEQRGPAPVAQALYAETPESVARRAAAAEQRRLSPEPAHSIEHGRPTKRDRRALQKPWDDRWSASID
ncbi:MAG: RNA-binding protein [Burkholderiales bacterium PBB4]|nr:MAG: RNA-binding protein [Burkholderiales bacterium PBB4]